MRYLGNRRRRGAWDILVAAGLFLVVLMGIVLIGLAFGFAVGAGLIKL